MERKIGEIFEYKGEWYQCVEGGIYCPDCVFFRKKCNSQVLGECGALTRSDKEDVIFKKLEKVGEPYVGNNRTFQLYKLAMPIHGDIPDQITAFTMTEVVIKQNEEDMEEGKLDPHMEKVIDEATQKMGEEIGRQIGENINKQRMKPFSLEAAKAAKPVCTRDGRKARIICFDAKSDAPIIALITTDDGTEIAFDYLSDGTFFNRENPDNDLMMLPEKKEGWVNIYHDKEGNIYTDENVYNTEKDAINFCPHDKCRVATVKIEWEE